MKASVTSLRWLDRLKVGHQLFGAFAAVLLLTAVLGATALVGDSMRSDQIESLEEMVEAIVALCDCPVEVTGGAFVSLDLLAAWGLDVHGLDGRVL